MASSSSPSSSSHLTREQQGLLNFEEVVALWYFILMLWYGYYRCRNWKVTTSQFSNSIDSTNTNLEQYGLSPIHWLIASIAAMGLANFLFSVSVLEALDHTSAIGSKVLKLSYINMFFACLRHPCTLSLGVLAPKVAFGSDRYFYFPSESAVRTDNIKTTAMCLAALVFAQVVLRMTENVITIFRHGNRDSAAVKLADLFWFVFDGIFLSWMVNVLYTITMEISRDEYTDRRGFFGSNRWQAWWKSRSLFFFWILYTVFVTLSTALILIGLLAFTMGAVDMTDEHFVFDYIKANAINDLLLLTGIAIILRPKLVGQSPSPFSTNSIGADETERVADVDYSLLLTESSEDDEGQSGGGETREEQGERSFEMTTTAVSSGLDSTAMNAAP